jgi:branched-chain amino acid transport system permease protein
MAQLVVSQFVNGLIVGALYGIVALAVTLTFGITGVVNFALGAFMVLGAYFTWVCHEIVGVSYVSSVILAIAGVSILGYLADVGLFRFTRNHLVNGLLVSIGLISIIEASVLLLWTATPKNLAYVLPGVVRVAGIVVPKIKLVVVAVLVTVVVITYVGLTRTWLGRAAFAYAQNPEAAALMGVRTTRLETVVFVYSTALVALGGALYASLYSIEPSLGTFYVLKGVEAAILAGVGEVLGSLVGGSFWASPKALARFIYRMRCGTRTG